ncbi:MAG: hypothetical protein RLO50_12890 [Azospirillaceae bacterium]
MADINDSPLQAAIARLDAALGRLEAAMADRERRQQALFEEMSQQTQADAEAIAERVDRAIETLEAVLKG